MAGGFPWATELTNATSYGASLATSSGTSITASATTNTKGAWTSLGTLASDTSALVVNQFPASASFSCDIGIGVSGSQVVIIKDLTIVNSAVSFVSNRSLFFPCSLPAGTQLWARCQSTAASAQVSILVTGFSGGSNSFDGWAGLDSLGFLSASTAGTTVTGSATLNTKGSYVALSAATPRDYCAIGFSDTACSVTGNFLLDIAIGAAGAERIILPNINGKQVTAETSQPFGQKLFPIFIPAGSRIAARLQGSAASQLARLTILAAYK
jgi:hypothetical protein